jgi:sn-glycerol 3-phosphate transport system ATP-binding protein
MRLEIRRLHNRLKATSIFVTHDQVEAMTLADQVVVMNNGRIEQVGKPTDVYRRPASTFVATFIGSPAMNLMSGRIAGSGRIETAGGTLAFDPAQFDVPAQRAVQVGVRPEDLQYVPPGAADGGLAFDGEFVEELGATRLFHGMSGGATLVVAVAASTTAEPKKGARLVAEVDTVHLFDAETGRSLRKIHGAR